MVRKNRACPASDEYRNRHDQRDSEVDMALAVVLPHRADPNWWQQYGEAGSSRTVLCEPGQIDERGHDDHAATDAEDAGE
jgi:hypothetical protein